VQARKVTVLLVGKGARNAPTFEAHLIRRGCLDEILYDKLFSRPRSSVGSPPKVFSNGSSEFGNAATSSAPKRVPESQPSFASGVSTNAKP
jgi:hypothetical protein